jgi:hypothetical protein
MHCLTGVPKAGSAVHPSFRAQFWFDPQLTQVEHLGCRGQSLRVEGKALAAI